VFIARKLNRRGSRYGFVRLYDVKNVGKLEKELDFNQNRVNETVREPSEI